MYVRTQRVPTAEEKNQPISVLPTVPQEIFQVRVKTIWGNSVYSVVFWDTAFKAAAPARSRLGFSHQEKLRLLFFFSLPCAPPATFLVMKGRRVFLL